MAFSTASFDLEPVSDAEESADIPSLLEEAKLPNGTLLYMDNPLWLAGDLFGEFYLIHDDYSEIVDKQRLSIRNKKTGESVGLDMPSIAHHAFNWPTCEDAHLFATLHADQMIIWDASNLNDIKQLQSIKLQLPPGANYDVQVFPGNRQLAISTQTRGYEKVLHLIDINNPLGPVQKRFDLDYGTKEEIFPNQSAETLLKFCIIDATHIALYMRWLKEAHTTQYFLRVRIWELDFTNKIWRKSDKPQDTTHIITNAACNDLEIGPCGKLIASQHQREIQWYELVNYTYMPRGKLNSSTLVGFASDGSLILSTKKSKVPPTERQRKDSRIGSHVFRFNPVTCETIQIHRGKKPKMTSGRNLMFNEKVAEHKVFDISEDPRPRLIAEELADALPKCSFDLLNLMLSYMHRAASMTLFTPVPAKVALNTEIANFLNSCDKCDRQALEQFRRNAKQGMYPIENVFDVKNKHQNISEKLAALFNSCVAKDPISLAHAQQKRIKTAPR